MAKKYFVDLFCGPGGLSKGLEKSGLVPLLAIDNDQDACNTYKLNHPNTTVLCEDIQQISSQRILSIIGSHKISVLCGGSPCQAFSTIGLRKADDPRAKLFFEFLKFADLLKPDYLVFENVKGILSINNGLLIKEIYKLFDKIGYSLAHNLIDCSKLGMCQKRERVIFIGSRSKIVKIESPDGIPKTLEQIISNVYLNKNLMNNSIIEPKSIDKERIKFIPEGKYFRNNRIGGVKNDIFPESSLHLKEGEGKTQKYHKLSRKSLTPTVLTNWYTMRMVAHYDNRPLTAREVARIQGFPDDYEFSGNIKSIYKQIGNAVPPQLGEFIGKLLL